MNYLESTATISACGLYRYDLRRRWDLSSWPALFVMLNPSTADGARDDPTIRRCVGFARSMGCGGLVVVNLFAWRAKDPDELRSAADPVGPDNDDVILRYAKRCSPVVAAWGAVVATANRPVLRERSIRVLQLLAAAGVDVYHLGITKDGHPRHPLYLPSAAAPAVWKKGALS